jgi:dTDP-4-dehydrorhamnose 3,5-epimerase
MIVTPGKLAGVFTVRPRRFADERGFFVERFNLAGFDKAGLPTTFCQDNHSRSWPRVIRGMHFQSDPPQGKLLGVVRGCIWDVLVDIRPDSPTYGQYLSKEMSDADGELVWIPPGMAHGFCVLGNEPADILYKVDQPYSPASEGGIVWNDPDLAIQWPIADPIVSARDRQLPSFADYRRHPPAW